MQYKFKTNIGNKLIPCIPDPVNNYVYMYDEECVFGLRIIGHLIPIPKSNYDTLEIFQYSGLNDYNGAEIYDGHLITPMDYPDYVVQIFYSKEEFSWEVKILAPDKKGDTDFIIYNLWRKLLPKSEIVGHSGLY